MQLGVILSTEEGSIYEHVLIFYYWMDFGSSEFLHGVCSDRPRFSGFAAIIPHHSKRVAMWFEFQICIFRHLPAPAAKLLRVVESAGRGVGVLPQNVGRRAGDLCTASRISWMYSLTSMNSSCP